MPKESTAPTRGALWCDRETAVLVNRVARLRGTTVREYVRELEPLFKRHLREAAALLAEEQTEPDPKLTS
jgi:hypothetical protein